MRASKADKFYMGMLLAIICFCFGLLRIMDEADARRAAERETLIIVEEALDTDFSWAGALGYEIEKSKEYKTNKHVFLRKNYFEPDPEPEEPAAEVFTFREDVPLSAELQEVLWDACQEHKVEYALALGLIETESSFNPEAVSYVGCYGLMQLNPDYFPTDLSPAENIQYGVAFIAEKLDQYAGNVGAALTAYNAGHDTGNREYAEKVMAAAERWRKE